MPDLCRSLTALGGITVNSDYDFDSKNILGYHFNKGENYVNGEQALIFARERYAFQEGDRQRGKNQMEVIRGGCEEGTFSGNPYQLFLHSFQSGWMLRY